MGKSNEALNGKPIGIWSAVAIGIGGMIGAGIFSILGIATTIAGNVVYISFIIGGTIALLSTYSYAKLATRYPSAGGPVEFLVRGFGDGVLSGGFNFLLWIGYIFALRTLCYYSSNSNYPNLHVHQFFGTQSSGKIRNSNCWNKSRNIVNFCISRIVLHKTFPINNFTVSPHY